MFHLMVPRRSRRSALPAPPDVRAFDSLFDELWRGFGVTPFRHERGGDALPGFSPQLDVRETESEIVVRAELPGLAEEDVEVFLDEDVLVLKGEKRSASDEEREGLRHVETRSGSFERRLRLSAPVKADAVKASFQRGVLTVTLPKPEEARPRVRTVPVSTA
jgi:HSP20 family protein